jgi:hypothetical protein
VRPRRWGVIASSPGLAALSAPHWAPPRRSHARAVVRSEPAPDAGLRSEPAQLRARTSLRPRPPAGRSLDDAEQRTEWQLEPPGDPRAEVLPAPVVHTHLAPPVALAAADEQRAATRIEVAFVELERLLDPEAARHSTTINARMRAPLRPSPAARMTATISPTRGGSAG